MKRTKPQNEIVLQNRPIVTSGSSRIGCCEVLRVEWPSSARWAKDLQPVRCRNPRHHDGACEQRVGPPNSSVMVFWNPADPPDPKTIGATIAGLAKVKRGAA